MRALKKLNKHQTCFIDPEIKKWQIIIYKKIIIILGFRFNIIPLLSIKEPENFLQNLVMLLLWCAEQNLIKKKKP